MLKSTTIASSQNPFVPEKSTPKHEIARRTGAPISGDDQSRRTSSPDSTSLFQPPPGRGKVTQKAPGRAHSVYAAQRMKGGPKYKKSPRWRRQYTVRCSIACTHGPTVIAKIPSNARTIRSLDAGPRSLSAPAPPRHNAGLLSSNKGREREREGQSEIRRSRVSPFLREGGQDARVSEPTNGFLQQQLSRARL